MKKTLSVLSANLHFLFKKYNLNPNKLADLLDKKPPQPTIARLADGEVGTPRDETLSPIAAFFKVSIHDLRYSNLAEKEQNSGNNARSSTLHSFPTFVARDVPVFSAGTLLDTKSLWKDDGTPQVAVDGWACVSTNDPLTFLIQITDLRLYPRFKIGEYGQVMPSLNFESDDDVLIKTFSGELILGRLMSRRGDRMTFDFYNKEFGVFAVDVAEVDWEFRVLNRIAAENVRRVTESSEDD